MFKVKSYYIDRNGDRYTWRTISALQHSGELENLIAQGNITISEQLYSKFITWNKLQPFLRLFDK